MLTIKDYALTDTEIKALLDRAAQTDAEDLAADAYASCYADDRQDTRTLDAGLAAVDELRARADAAPALAVEVLRLRAEVERLRAMPGCLGRVRPEETP